MSWLIAFSLFRGLKKGASQVALSFLFLSSFSSFRTAFLSRSSLGERLKGKKTEELTLGGLASLDLT